MARELAALGRIFERPERPVWAVLGGAKVSDKLALVEHLLDRGGRRSLIGGGMAFTFLAALGHGVGRSLLEPDRLDAARAILERARSRGVPLRLPVDVVAAAGLDATSGLRTVGVREIPGRPDGPRHRPGHGRRSSPPRSRAPGPSSGTARWASSRRQPFAAGTLGVARAVGECGAFSVIGGGDTIAAVQQAGVTDRIGYISTAGGAFLEFLEGRVLPGRGRARRGALMRTPLVVGNWKMHGTLAEARELAQAIRDGLKRPRGVEVAVCPPFTALPAVAEVLAGSPGRARGARTATGRTRAPSPARSRPPMLAELGCRCVLLGHSERRHVFRETDEEINRKVVRGAAARPRAGALRRRDGGRAAPGADLHGGRGAAPRRLGRARRRGDRALRARLRAGLGHRHRASTRRRPRPPRSTATFAGSSPSSRRRSSPSPCASSTAAASSPTMRPALTAGARHRRRPRGRRQPAGARASSPSRRSPPSERRLLEGVDPRMFILDRHHPRHREPHHHRPRAAPGGQGRRHRLGLRRQRAARPCSARWARRPSSARSPTVVAVVFMVTSFSLADARPISRRRRPSCRRVGARGARARGAGAPGAAPVSPRPRRRRSSMRPTARDIGAAGRSPAGLRRWRAARCGRDGPIESRSRGPPAARAKRRRLRRHLHRGLDRRHHRPHPQHHLATQSSHEVGGLIYDGLVKTDKDLNWVAVDGRVVAVQQGLPRR